MTWSELEKEYAKRIGQYVPASKREAKAGMEQLEREVQLRFPEAYKNPILLVDTEWPQVYNKFRASRNGNAEGFKEVSSKCFHALRRTRSILKRAYNFNALDKASLTADLYLFGKKEVMYCFSSWMRQNNYTQIKLANTDHDLRDITARRDEYNVTCKAIASVRKSNYSNNLVVLENGFKSSLGRILIFMMEEQNAIEKTEAVLLIADDKTTRETIMPFLDYIKKIGIRMYAVYSVNKVTEL
jgi:hypothetical protein